ncbi:hypothetical protein QBC46DRAFT_306871 [Diplogelasinospora grovesii]|uniref:Uncharacterized protein n=1 Tax=Diplogelasinospora grovesii TaxID=303347 RepID=A0AAN6S8A2_9PEZI|nr:hypothetical protein QBC46DRAFT_306871 [Diplogelasinospora grovesii]
MARSGKEHGTFNPSTSFQWYSDNLGGKTRIPRRYVQVPKDQQALLDRPDAWETRGICNVPPEVLQGLREFHSRKPSPTRSSASHTEPEDASHNGTQVTSTQETPIPWTPSPEWHLEPPTPVDGSDGANTPSRRLTRAVSRAAAILPPFPSSPVDDDDMEIEVPGAITDPVPPINKAALRVLPEPTPPSAQIIPCTNPTSAVKPHSAKRRRLVVEVPSRLRNPELVDREHAPASGLSRLAIATPARQSSAALPVSSSQVSQTAKRIPKQPPAVSLPVGGERSPLAKDQAPSAAPTPQNSTSQQQSSLVSDKVPPNGPPSQPFTAFKLAYSDYKGSLRDFVRAVMYLHDLRQRDSLMEFLYDDFVRVFSREYVEYVAALDGNAPALTAFQWYNRYVTEPAYTKKILTKGNINDVLGKYPVEVRAIKGSLLGRGDKDEPLRETQNVPDEVPSTAPDLPQRSTGTTDAEPITIANDGDNDGDALMSDNGEPLERPPASATNNELPSNPIETDDELALPEELSSPSLPMETRPDPIKEEEEAEEEDSDDDLSEDATKEAIEEVEEASEGTPEEALPVESQSPARPSPTLSYRTSAANRAESMMVDNDEQVGSDALEVPESPLKPVQSVAWTARDRSPVRSIRSQLSSPPPAVPTAAKTESQSMPWVRTQSTATSQFIRPDPPQQETIPPDDDEPDSDTFEEEPELPIALPQRASREVSNGTSSIFSRPPPSSPQENAMSAPPGESVQTQSTSWVRTQVTATSPQLTSTNTALQETIVIEDDEPDSDSVEYPELPVVPPQHATSRKASNGTPSGLVRPPLSSRPGSTISPPPRKTTQTQSIDWSVRSQEMMPAISPPPPTKSIKAVHQQPNGKGKAPASINNPVNYPSLAPPPFLPSTAPLPQQSSLAEFIPETTLKPSKASVSVSSRPSDRSSISESPRTPSGTDSRVRKKELKKMEFKDPADRDSRRREFLARGLGTTQQSSTAPMNTSDMTAVSNPPPPPPPPPPPTFLVPSTAPLPLPQQSSLATEFIPETTRRPSIYKSSFSESQRTPKPGSSSTTDSRVKKHRKEKKERKSEDPADRGRRFSEFLARKFGTQHLLEKAPSSSCSS